MKPLHFLFACSVAAVLAGTACKNHCINPSVVIYSARYDTAIPTESRYFVVKYTKGSGFTQPLETYAIYDSVYSYDTTVINDTVICSGTFMEDQAPENYDWKYILPNAGKVFEIGNIKLNSDAMKLGLSRECSNSLSYTLNDTPKYIGNSYEFLAKHGYRQIDVAIVLGY